MQEGRPLAFLSKKLGVRHMGLSIYEKEFLVVLMAIQRWRHYLQGHKFIIKTDQQALKYLLDQRITTPLQQKWITKLLGLNYDIQYKKGVENKVADALSRKELDKEGCYSLSTVKPVWVQQVLESYDKDPFFSQIIKEKLEDPVSHPDFEIFDGILRYQGRLVIGSNTELRHTIYKELHASAVGGHSGIQGTYMRIKRVFYWPRMKNNIILWIKECEVCAKTKPDGVPYPGLLQPLPIPDQAWSHISMDFIEGLPKSQGKDVILVVVDRLTKYGHFLPLSHPYTAHTVAKMFLDNVYKLHGQPIDILSDRDAVFLSGFWKELFKLMGTHLSYTSAYHPQTDGQTERLNQCLEAYLRAMTHQNPRQWVQWLSLAEYWYNTNYHSSTKTTPFEALYGHTHPTLSIPTPSALTNIEVRELINHRQRLKQELKENLKLAQERMKYFADNRRVDREFEVGDRVYLKLQPYRQHSVFLRRNQKLAARYYGPYTILERIGRVAYRLDLPEDTKIHPVFHVSLLKRCISPRAEVSTTIPPVDKDGCFIITSASVKGICRDPTGTARVTLLLALKADGGIMEGWVSKANFRKMFPKIDPWGQGSLKGGGIVMFPAKSFSKIKISCDIREEKGTGSLVGSMPGKEDGLE
ncbi:unnamed protein product [Cuscuta epithymum]|uniref:Integrase catalytic domain-containing protein n=1 Tax=Cuscuta epithymum TaxID=186058 RepID=A0AAV0EEA9_9ASTE|nr:unnamed protein product [Cuscuta epithymum]